VILSAAAENPLSVAVSTDISPVAGSNLNIICVVTKIDGQLQAPTATWFIAGNETVTNSSVEGIYTTMNSSSDVAVNILTLIPLRFSHSSLYTCVGSIHSLNSTLTRSEMYLLKVPCKLSESGISFFYISIHFFSAST
jgi:hypothetical protein